MSCSFSVSSSSRHHGAAGGSASTGGGGGGNASKPLHVVRFALDDEMCEYHEVRRLDSYTRDEMKDIWFTKEDYRQMGEETKVIIDSMEKYESNVNKHNSYKKKSRNNKNCGGGCTHHYYNSSSICGGHYVRGLENKTQNGSVKKKMANLDGVCAVLVEQERQKREGMITSPQSDESLNLISKAYRQVTAANVREAMERGGYDAQQVRRTNGTNNEQDDLANGKSSSTPLTRLWILARASPSTAITKRPIAGVPTTTTTASSTVGGGGTTGGRTTTTTITGDDLASTFAAMKLAKSRQQQHQRGTTTTTTITEPSQQFVGARERIRSFLGRTSRTVRRTSSSNAGRG